MATTRSVALLVAVTVVAVAGLTVAPVASGALASTISDDAEPEQDDDGESPSVGEAMQVSAADAETSVDSEMFNATYGAADNETRGTLVLERTDDLEDRLADLRAERDELEEQRDELNVGEYQARMSQHTVQIQALEREIDRTTERANETGVDTERLDELRGNASELAGGEVANIAQRLAGITESPGQGLPAEPGNQSQHGGDPGQTPDDDDPGQPPDDDHPSQAPDDDDPGHGQGD